MSDLISIIVPIYNASQYLSECIESIQRQTYQNLEIILINDGSTDDSLEICSKYQRQDCRIKLIDQNNGGSVAARKSGLRAALGAYIGFVDADDSIEPDMFQTLYQKLKDFDVDFVHSGMITNGQKRCDYEEKIIDFSTQNRTEYFSRKVFETQEIFYALWSKLFKAELIKKAFLSLPDEQCYGEDLLCMCNYLSQCRSFYLLKDAFYHYRVHESSLSHLNWLDFCIEESRLYSHVLKRLEENKMSAECSDSAKYHCRQRILSGMVQDTSSGIHVLTYMFENVGLLKGKRVVLYGAGNVGQDYYKQFTEYGLCKLAAWVDRGKYGVRNLITIEKPERIREVEYDVIVLAVKHEEAARSIRKDLAEMGVADIQKSVIWEAPVTIW